MQPSLIGQVIRLGAAIAALTLATTDASAQEWPKRGTITIVLPFAASGSDTAARVLADGLTKKLGQQVIIENRGGAGGTIGTAFVVNEGRPDGYTFLITGPAPIVNAPALYKKLSYDPSKLVPISMVFSTPIMMIVNADFANDVKEAIAKAKATPEGVLAFDGGNGSNYQLLHMMFEDAAGVKLNKVSYKAVSQGQVDLLANRINMVLDFPAAWIQHAKEGKVKILANLDTKRDKDFPNVLTFAEAGLPSYPAWLGWFAMFGPPGLPADIQTKMNAAIVEVLKQPDIADKFGLLSFTPTPSDPKAVLDRIDLELKVVTKVAKERNISLEQ